MGCKESKHKAAAGNTFITPSPSKKNSNIVTNNNNVKEITENPTNVESPLVQKQKSLKQNGDSKANISDEGTSNIVNIAKNENEKGDTKVDEKIKENKVVEELRKGNVGELNTEKEGVVEDKGKVDSDCDESSKKNFSTRKDDVNVEGIISDGISGTSVYYTPHKEVATEDQSVKSENMDEEKEESIDETKDETKTDEAGANVTEENMVEKVEADAGLIAGGVPVRESEITTSAEETPGEEVKAADVIDVNPVKETDVNTPAEENPVELAKATDVIEVNPVKEAEATSSGTQNAVKELDAVEDDLVKVIKSADINEDDPVKEAEAPQEEENVVQVAEDEPVKEAPQDNMVTEEKVIDMAEEKPVEQTEVANDPMIKAEVVEENNVKEAEAAETSEQPEAVVGLTEQESVPETSS